MIEQIGVLDYRVIVHDKIKTDEVNEFDKILITPGPGLPEDHPILEKVIRQYSPTKSILGICLGHQAIAKSFGGELFRQGNVSHGIAKKIIIKDSADYLFNNLPGEMNVGLYHSWAVSEINFPSELKITAVSEDGINMALSHRRFDVKGVQFHPESIMTKLGKQLLKNWIENRLN
jgi:anthranilate synthase component 2